MKLVLSLCFVDKLITFVLFCTLMYVKIKHNRITYIKITKLLQLSQMPLEGIKINETIKKRLRK